MYQIKVWLKKSIDFKTIIKIPKKSNIPPDPGPDGKSQIEFFMWSLELVDKREFKKNSKLKSNSLIIFFN